MPIIGSSRIFQIKDFQTLASQSLLNVYNYIATGPGDYDAEDVARAVEADVVASVAGSLQTPDVVHTIIEAEEITVLDNFFSGASVVGAGAIPGQVQPNYVAVTLSLRRATKETRNGSKRIAGISEDDMAGNIIGAGYMVGMNVVAAKMGLTLTVISGGDLTPIILSKRRDGNGDLLPVSQWWYNFISDVVPSNVVTTQNSRKLGVGV